MSEIQRATPEVVRRIEERWAGLLPRVEAKLQTVNGFDRGQEMRLLDQAAQASSVAKRVMWLRKAADTLHGSIASLAACRKGCSHCCHISVMLSRAEAKVIAKETRGRFNEAAVQITLDDTQERRDALEAITRQIYGQAWIFLREGS